MTQAAPPFAPPRTHEPPDVDGEIARLPADATVKGLYIRCVLSQLPRFTDPAVPLEKSQLGARKFSPLGNYSAAGFFRLCDSVAGVIHPALPRAEGLRRLGRMFYPTLADSLPGRVVFGVLGRDASRIFPSGHQGWRMSGNFGRVETEIVGKKHVRYHLREYVFIDTLQLGVVEGALEFCGVKGRVLAAMGAPGNGVLDVEWS